MLSAFKYRIYPNPEQEVRLKRSLLLLCELYNRLRAEKIEQYKQRGVSLTRNSLRALALDQRRNNRTLQTIYSQVTLTVADRVHTAFKSFFGGRSRFPRYKQPKKYLSMIFPQSGFRIDSRKRLHLSGMGHVRIFTHRPLLGKVKRLTIKREADKWYAIFTTERDTPQKQPIEAIPGDRVRGADLGLEKFVVFDNASETDYPEFLRRSETKIRTLQRHVTSKRKGSKRWKQLCFRLARLHLHIGRQREDWQNKLIHEIFANNDMLILEKLNIERMLKNHGLAKSFSDASFGRFARKAIFKAELLGKHFIAVDPWGTTQFCHNCLTWVPKDLSQREHRCPNCGIIIPRDLNSALLIKWLGIHSSPPSDGGSSLAEPRPLPSLRGMVSQGDEAGSLALGP